MNVAKVKSGVDIGMTKSSNLGRSFSIICSIVFLGVLGPIIWPTFLMLTCPCNLDPPRPYFYIVKLGL